MTVGRELEGHLFFFSSDNWGRLKVTEREGGERHAKV